MTPSYETVATIVDLSYRIEGAEPTVEGWVARFHNVKQAIITSHEDCPHDGEVVVRRGQVCCAMCGEVVKEDA